MRPVLTNWCLSSHSYALKTEWGWTYIMRPTSQNGADHNKIVSTGFGRPQRIALGIFICIFIGDIYFLLCSNFIISVWFWKTCSASLETQLFVLFLVFYLLSQALKSIASLSGDLSSSTEPKSQNSYIVFVAINS